MGSEDLTHLNSFKPYSLEPITFLETRRRGVYPDYISISRIVMKSGCKRPGKNVMVPQWTGLGLLEEGHTHEPNKSQKLRADIQSRSLCVPVSYEVMSLSGLYASRRTQ